MLIATRSTADFLVFDECGPSLKFSFVNPLLSIVAPSLSAEVDLFDRLFSLALLKWDCSVSFKAVLSKVNYLITFHVTIVTDCSRIGQNPLPNSFLISLSFV